MYKNRLREIDELKAKIDNFRSLSDDILKQIQEYYKIARVRRFDAPRNKL